MDNIIWRHRLRGKDNIKRDHTEIWQHGGIDVDKKIILKRTIQKSGKREAQI
jgi:hypothetical protein